ncbi:PadR family transcriptional regulator [Salimicrobium halophilum]|uniref:Transcriptional regulator PadR-like family protein n=1 Tax=Salimicrobium halophilum TaxID=86666 RepID=A0A1G8T0L0_9BACI|nr:helix-turn-helix transcriptional regulator [Salimicrobium halophilum]SDJ34987.1 Transcriptional regulator PadR-like family protein [Salimicrobium halophilum]
MSMKILIMGLLKERPRHPYEMKRAMIDQKWNKLISITDGNLYHNIRRAEERGNIRGIKTEKVDQRPNRTVYELTEQGEEELSDMIVEVFRNQKMDVSLVYPALLFVRYSDKSLVEQALRSWAADLDAESVADAYAPPAYHIVEHFEQRKNLDRKWLLEVADWIKDD